MQQKRNDYMASPFLKFYFSLFIYSFDQTAYHKINGQMSSTIPDASVIKDFNTTDI